MNLGLRHSLALVHAEGCSDTRCRAQILVLISAWNESSPKLTSQSLCIRFPKASLMLLLSVQSYYRLALQAEQSVTGSSDLSFIRRQSIDQ